MVEEKPLGAAEIAAAYVPSVLNLGGFLGLALSCRRVDDGDDRGGCELHCLINSNISCATLKSLRFVCSV